MFYRIAKKSDLNQIVNIHYSTRDVNDNGIFAQMGKTFLKAYYKVVLKSKNTFCVCAENEEKKVLGFIFFMLDSKIFNKEILLNKHRFIFGIILSVLTNPYLIISLFNRYKSIKNQDNKFVHNKGVRGGFWGWDPEIPDSLSSFELHERGLAVLKSLGYREVFFEVDKINQQVYKFHNKNGAEELEIILLDDGRERAVMKYDLLIHKYRI